MPDPIPVPTPDAWGRVSKVVRDAETVANSPRDGDVEAGPGYYGIVVEVTGNAIEVTTTTVSSSTTTPTTTTDCGANICSRECQLIAGVYQWVVFEDCVPPCVCPPYTVDPCDSAHIKYLARLTCESPATSSTTTTTTTTCAPVPSASTTTSATTTTRATKKVYPARFVHRNMDSTKDKEWWFKDEDCYAQETNDGPLGVGCRYPAVIAGEYRGLALVAVRGNGVGVSCTSSSTSTTGCECGGDCLWTLTGGVWVLTTNSCVNAGCDCPQPDFCPADAGCGITRTLCAKGADHSEVVVNCGSTTTSSSTTTGTTTTADPTGCGMGCSWKLVPGVGIVTLLSDCAPGRVLGSGWVCGGCAIPALTPCAVVSVPCGSFPPPPPPPGCRGTCDWVWPDVAGSWWVQVSAECTSGVNDGCGCDPPAAAGGECGQVARTSCFPHAATTTGTGTGTETTSATTTPTSTTRGGCGDWCEFRWTTAGGGSWVKTLDCGSACDCSKPLWNGNDDCDVARSPCVTTTTTTTTSSTTATTTTTNCGTYNCTRTCTHNSGLNFSWNVTTPCPTGCNCPPITDIACYFSNVGATATRPCVAAPTTTSATSSTSSRTTITGPENPCVGQCVFSCMLTGVVMGRLTGLPEQGVYEWTVCSDVCPPDYTCTLPPGSDVTCTPDQAGQVIRGACIPNNMSSIALGRRGFSEDFLFP